MDNKNLQLEIRDLFASDLQLRGLKDCDELFDFCGGPMDSIKLMEVIELLEQKFNISVEAHEIFPGHFGSIEKISQYVEKKLL